MELTPLFVIVLPILTVLAVGLLGRTRRLGFWLAIIASIFLTPIGGFLLALISGQRKPKRKPTPQEAKKEAKKKAKKKA